MIAKLRYYFISLSSQISNKSLILPYLTYKTIFYGKCKKKYLKEVVVLQKRVLHSIYFTDRKEHVIPLFANEKLQLPITLLHYNVVCKLMLDVRDDSAPSNVMKLFTRRSNIHFHTTRLSTSQNFNA